MWQTMTNEEIRRKLKTNLEYGITEEEAKLRQKEYGKNKLDEKKKTNIIIKFLLQFNDFMIIVLIIAAVISALISYVEKSNEYIDSIIIIAIVVFNSLMGLIQECKAEKSLEALAKMAAPTAKVKRGGIVKEIPSEDVVPGDVIVLETGNFVPADCKLIKSYNLNVEESALTGETVPIEKQAEEILSKNLNLGDITNMAFATTIVVSRTWRSNSMRHTE